MVDQRSTGAQPYQQKTHDVATSAEATTFMHRMNGKGLQIFPSSLNASLTTSYGLTNSGNSKQIKQIKQYCCYDHNMQRAGAVASLAPCLQQGPINLHFGRNSTVKTYKNSQLILEGFEVRKPSKTLKHNKNATIATSCSKIQWRLVWDLSLRRAGVLWIVKWHTLLPNPSERFQAVRISRSDFIKACSVYSHILHVVCLLI